MFSEGTLGSRIKKLRKELGITQDKLSEDMLIPKTTLSSYENDKVDIKGSVLLELSRHLFTSPNYLLGFDSENEGDNQSSEPIAVNYHKIKDKKVQRFVFLMVKLASMMYR